MGKIQIKIDIVHLANRKKYISLCDVLAQSRRGSLKKSEKVADKSKNCYDFMEKVKCS